MGVKYSFYKMAIGGSHVLTNIPANASDTNPKAYHYTVSWHTSDGDNTFFEHGIIRIGYSGDNVSKQIICEKRYSSCVVEFGCRDGLITVYYPIDVYCIIHIWS